MADNTQPQDSSQGQTDGAGETPVNGQPNEGQPLDFTAWFNTLAPEQQELVDTHVDGLKTALKSEREEKKALERKLKDLTKQATEGSELHQQLTALQTELQTTSAKATFMEQAIAAKVANPRLAWLAATDGQLVNMRTGECDFGKLREVAPEVFQQKPAATTINAGSGAGQNGVKQADMNSLIRDAVFGQRRGR